MRVYRFGACSHKPLLCGFSKLRLRGEVWPQVGNRGLPRVGALLVPSRLPSPAHFSRYGVWSGVIITTTITMTITTAIAIRMSITIRHNNITNNNNNKINNHNTNNDNNNDNNNKNSNENRNSVHSLCVFIALALFPQATALWVLKTPAVRRGVATGRESLLSLIINIIVICP